MSDEPNWSELTDSYGPAQGLGQLIQQTTSGDRSIAAEASWELQDRISHSGAISEAAVPALAVVIKLVERRAVPHLAELLVTILVVARSIGRWQRLPASSASYNAQVRWEEEAHAILEEASDMFMSDAVTDNSECRSIGVMIWGNAAVASQSNIDRALLLAADTTEDKVSSCYRGAAASLWARHAGNQAAPIPDWVKRESRTSDCSLFRIRDALIAAEVSVENLPTPLSTRAECSWPAEL